MVRIYLQRHTKPDVDSNRCYGVSDIPLSEEFEGWHLPQVLESIKGCDVQRIYSSPLQRCLRLAIEIKSHLNINDVTIDNRVMELNFGDWELALWDDIFATAQGKEWFAEYLNCQTPNGESFVQMVERAESFLADVKADGQDAVVVTHSGFIRAVMVALGRVAPQEAFDMKIEYGELIEVHI